MMALGVILAVIFGKLDLVGWGVILGVVGVGYGILEMLRRPKNLERWREAKAEWESKYYCHRCGNVCAVD